jgi:hypothetical protein
LSPSFNFCSVAWRNRLDHNWPQVDDTGTVHTALQSDVTPKWALYDSEIVHPMLLWQTKVEFMQVEHQNKIMRNSNTVMWNII